MSEIRFIAHAGVAVRASSGDELLIDPWFSDSTIEKPLLRSLFGGHKTIDFQVPKTTESIGDYAPGTVLVSHFHTHHAPHDDILTLMSQSESVLFGHPHLGEQDKDLQAILEPFPQVERQPFYGGASVSRGPFRITAYEHTVPGHLAWMVEAEGMKILHVADARANKDPKTHALDEAWAAFDGLRPDVLFVNGSRNSIRYETKEKKRMIDENACLSPIEAAQLVARIQPKAVSLIGCYNRSIFRNREEFIPYTPSVEEEFHWAVSWLSPDTAFIPARPGHVYR